MDGQGRRLLWALMAIGLVGRLVIAFSTYGETYDVQAFALVREALGADALNLYGDLERRWPYPPGYFPWIALAVWLEGPTGLHFSDLIQLPMIGADLALAYLVQLGLGWRRASERVRLAARILPLPLYPDQLARLSGPKSPASPEAGDLGFSSRTLRKGLETC